MYKQTNTICKPNRIRLFALIINCIVIMKTKSPFPWNICAIRDRIWCNKHLRHTTTENMITTGKVDTSNLMMIITWAMDISFQSPKLKWAGWTYTTPYIVMEKVIERTYLHKINSMLNLIFWKKVQGQNILGGERLQNEKCLVSKYGLKRSQASQY